MASLSTLTQRPGDHVVDASGCDLPVGRNGGHGQRGQEGDQVAHGQNTKTLEKAFWKKRNNWLVFLEML